MKKALFLLALSVLSACHLRGEETFVNPVFYGKLESLNDLWDIKITPTTFDMDNRHGTTWHEDCEMWENEPKKVVLRCTHQLNKEQLEMQSPQDVYGIRTEEHTTYVIEFMSEKYQDSDEGIFIVIDSYYEDETSRMASRGYFIRTPEKEEKP